MLVFSANLHIFSYMAKLLPEKIHAFVCLALMNPPQGLNQNCHHFFFGAGVCSPMLSFSTCS